MIKNKRIILRFIIILALLIYVSLPAVKAGSGYTYDSKGNPIYSTEGFTVNEMPKSYSDLGISSTGVSTPSDLFVYKPTDGSDVEIYLTDSTLNSVYVLNSSLEKVNEFTYFIFKPENLYMTDLNEIKTKVEGDTVSKNIFPNSESIPAPGGEYIKLFLNGPTATYRSVTTYRDTTRDLIYVCDKTNNQVVVLDATKYNPTYNTYEIYQIVTKPTDMDKNTKFGPKKIITDSAGRMYIIAENVLDGIMQFSIEGTFDRYTGTNEITLSAWEIFWRNFSTEEQLAKKKTLYNTTFNSMVYSNTTIYTTSQAISNSDGTKNTDVMIKKINLSGDDILRRNGYSKPMGDVKFAPSKSMETADNGPSQLVGITVNDYGVYSVVDQQRGRIFTYDNEGNLLYISSGKGIQSDRLEAPVAIQYLGENLLVLDKNKRTIIKFELTEIAEVINKAVYQEYIGRTAREGIVPIFNKTTKTWWIAKHDTLLSNDKAIVKVNEETNTWFIDGVDTTIKDEDLAAADYWEQVVRLNANYEYAYVGIGHKYLRQKDYKKAMYYFELGKNPVYYSKAFKLYRDSIIKKWFAPVVITIAVLAIGNAIRKKIRNKKLGIVKEEETGVGDE